MYIRYNEVNKYYEYDTSNGAGTGPWLILPISYSQIYNPPTIPPATVIPPDIAFTNVNNTFTAGQEIRAINPYVTFFDLNQPVDQRRFNVAASGQKFYITSVNDASTLGYGSFNVDRVGNLALSGAIFERGRTTALGQWSAASIAGTVVNVAGLVGDIQWTIIGKTYSIALNLSGVIPATAYVLLTIPGGFTANINAGMSYMVYSPGNPWHAGLFNVSGNQIFLYDAGGVPFVAGQVYLDAMITFPVQ